MWTLEVFGEYGAELLQTLDGAHRSYLEKLQEVTDALTTAVADGIPFAVAGLTETINGLVNDEVSTFSNCDESAKLGNLSPEGAAAGLRAPIEAAGKRTGDETSSAVVKSSSNYSYLGQLIGYKSWQSAGSADEIMLDHVREAAASAKETMFRQVHKPTLANLPERERAYMAAVVDQIGVPTSHTGMFNRGLVITPRRSSASSEPRASCAKSRRRW